MSAGERRRSAGTGAQHEPVALDERTVEALTLAMTLAPGVYVRNRMFDFFASSGVRRARTRAALLRGIVPQLARAHGVTLTSESARGLHGEGVLVLRYAIPSVRLSRVIELSSAELAAVRLAAERSNVNVLPAAPEDRHVVATALARLLRVAGPSSDLAKGVAQTATPSTRPSPFAADAPNES